MVTIGRIFGIGFLLGLTVLIFGACQSDDASEEPPVAAPTVAAAATVAVAAPSEPVPTAVPQATTPPASQPVPTAVPQATTPPASQPAVQRVVFSVGPPPLSNAVRDVGGSNTIQLRPMYDYLISIDPENGNFVPGLATEWNIESGGLAVNFKLREGVQFHGGWGEFTAQDVVHSLADLVSPDSPHPSVGLFEDTSIDVINDHEIVWNMESSSADLLPSISELVSGIEIQSKAHFDSVGRPVGESNPPIAGTGGYQYLDQGAGTFIRFARTDSAHWRTTPDFPEMEIRWSPETSTRMAALLTGEIHVTPLSSDLERTAQQFGMTLVAARAPRFRFFLNMYCCNLKDPANPSAGYIHPESPLLDVRVRKALSKAIDREEINDFLLAGRGQINPHAHIGPTSPNFNQRWATDFQSEFGYDPDAARNLLAQAGYNDSNPLETNIILQNFADLPEAEDIQEVIAGYFDQVGVKATILTMDRAQVSALRRAFEFDNHIVMSRTASHDLVAFRVYGSSIPPRAAVEIAEINPLLRQAMGTTDPGKQGALVTQIADLYYDNASVIPLLWRANTVTVDPTVVADYIFPGSISGIWTHLTNIKAAR